MSARRGKIITGVVGDESGVNVIVAEGVGTPRQATDFDRPEFLDRIRRRDPEAIAAVVQTYMGQLMGAARTAGLDAVRAEDAVQATFATFIERSAEFERRSKLRTWLFGILFRKIAESRRARQRDDEVDDVDRVFEERFDRSGSWVRPPRDPFAELEAAEVRTAIGGCLNGAPSRQRTAFILREVEGFTTQEICTILGVTATNLGVMLHRIRTRLRECLETKGVTA